MEFNKNKKKIRDKSFFFVWMACLIFSLFFIAYFFFLRTSEVDVTKHIILQYMSWHSSTIWNRSMSCGRSRSKGCRTVMKMRRRSHRSCCLH